MRIERFSQTEQAPAQAALDGGERRAGHFGNFFELHLFFKTQGQDFAVCGRQIIHGGKDVAGMFARDHCIDG